MAAPEHARPTTPEDIENALAAFFDPREVKFKPAVVSGTRALAMAYVDARVIQDRLDDVMGVTNWQDQYEFLPDGAAVCKLSLRIAGEWIVKMDVGGQSEQPDEGDRRKAAVSDALKRAAVKFGIGRYLYRLPSQWCDYDPHKKQFVRTPSLPASALPPKATATAVVQQAPKAMPAPASQASPAPTTTNGHMVADLLAWLAKDPTDKQLSERARLVDTWAEPDRTNGGKALKAHAERAGLEWNKDTKSYVKRKEAVA